MKVREISRNSLSAHKVCSNKARGAQMIMMADWHPDVIEFIVSKVQNPYILRKIIKETKDPVIKRVATEKLKFEPLNDYERVAAETIVNCSTPNKPHYQKATSLLHDGGKYSVESPDFLTGANISVAISDDFMKAVENDEDWTFIFPDTENYSTEEMEYYDTHWQDVGDAREWRDAGHAVKEYNTIRAKDLWKLINICATYSAEPGVFFMDRANHATNATAYGQRVVATNPCGEQPLAGMSVCNLSALNLSKFVDKKTHEVDFEKLAEATWIAIRLQDNIIDATPYFLDENEAQAMGERRIGLGVMGLADMLIYANKRYGSEEGNELLDKVFETIAVESYRASIELAKEKGSFGFMRENPAGISTEEVRERFINTGYTKTMPERIKQDILKYGIRNSHTTTIAPTGSTGSMVNVSTGLEPYFAFKYYRSGRLGSFMEVNSPIVQEYLSEHSEATEDNLPDFFVTAMELSPEEHVSVQNTIQRWVDSSISKTVNMPRGSSPDEVAEVYMKLYNGGAKGGTVYVDGSRDTQVLSLAAEDNKSFDEDIDINKEELTEEEPQIDTMTDKKRVGTEVGDTCPVCRNGHVIDSGGCNTCDNCGAQLTCGL